MQSGSTGLGQTKLKFKLMSDEEASEGMPSTFPGKDSPMVILKCKTYDPVIWKLWVGVERSDIPALFSFLFRWSTICAIFRMLFTARKDKIEQT